MKRQESCQARITANYHERQAEILRAMGIVRASRKWAAEYDYPENKADWLERWFESVLEFGPAGEYTRGIKVGSGCQAVRVLLSTGGPEDGFILGVKRNRYGWEVTEVHYWFSDWFDGAHMKIRAGSRFERALMDLFEPWLDGLKFETEDETL